jgi:formylglycine-generating enzyme required for sulfatase activity
VDPSQFRRIDAVCDAFEAELRAGRRPAIEEQLPLVPEQDREQLRGHLLRLEEYYLPARQQAGRCLLREVLGQGGMGRVHRAFDGDLKREVAVKVMLPHVAADEVLRRRFLREARAMAALDHPHVVSIFHVDESGPTPFFVMPLLRGETLQARVTRERRLPVPDVIRIGRQTAEGLAHAHERGLIHRDVKPLNLWLEEGTVHVKILDFGLVHMDPESMALTRMGMVLGTYGFMAPEQAMGGEVDHRCDQYALGCVLYLICTGRAVATAQFRPPDAINTSVPRRLGEVIMRLLSVEPKDRFWNMGEVVRELTSLERPATTGARTRDPAPVAVWGERAMPVVLPGEEVLRYFTNSIGMRLVLVKPGTFLMGSPEGEEDRGEYETQHEVTITRPFYLGAFPVTQGQWKAVMGDNPSWFCRNGVGRDDVRDVSGADLDLFPVESVSWEEAQDFLKKLAARDEVARNGRKFRLPTEAEWEYACRGGHLIQEIGNRHTLPFHFDGPLAPQPYSSLSSTQANFDGSRPYGGAARGPYLERPSKVGSYEPNALGLYDMHGNVWEWCLDWFGDYPKEPATDPSGATEGSDRVYRGGGWRSPAWFCRSANRRRNLPVSRFIYLGFRVALDPSR